MALVAEIDGPVEAALAAVEGHDGPLGVVAQEQCRRLRAEIFPGPRQRAQHLTQEAVELGQSEALGDEVAQELLGDLEQRRAGVGCRDLAELAALQPVAQDTLEDGLVDVEEADADELLDASRQDLEDVHVLVDGDAFGQERLIEHLDPHGQAATHAAVNSHSPQ